MKNKIVDNIIEILINRHLNLTEIKAKICEIYSIDPSEVLIVDDIAKADTPKIFPVLCHVQELDGDFKQMISIYPDRSLSPLWTHEVSGSFCEFFKCECLVSDDDEIDPYSMILIKGVNNYQKVYLSPDYLDEDKYVIGGYR